MLLSKSHTFIRYAVFVCVLIIVVLSLLPAQDMYRTAAPKGVEHFIAYCGTGSLMALAFRGQWRPLAFAVVGMILLACLMEELQQFSPGRTMHISDFLASSAGAIVGIILGRYVAHYAGKRWPQLA